MPVTEALYAARNLEFSPRLEIEYFGDAIDLIGAEITMEVRLYPGAADPALATDNSVTVVSDTEVGTATNPATGDVEPLRRLVLEPMIPQVALDALPGLNQPEAGDSQRFWQEIKITYADLKRDSLWIGEFVLEAGVNRA